MKIRSNAKWEFKMAVSEMWLCQRCCSRWLCWRCWPQKLCKMIVYKQTTSIEPFPLKFRAISIKNHFHQNSAWLPPPDMTLFNQEMSKNPTNMLVGLRLPQALASLNVPRSQRPPGVKITFTESLFYTTSGARLPSCVVSGVIFSCYLSY